MSVAAARQQYLFHLKDVRKQKAGRKHVLDEIEDLKNKKRRLEEDMAAPETSRENSKCTKSNSEKVQRRKKAMAEMEKTA